MHDQARLQSQEHETRTKANNAERKVNLVCFFLICSSTVSSLLLAQPNLTIMVVLQMIWRIAGVATFSTVVVAAWLEILMS